MSVERRPHGGSAKLGRCHPSSIAISERAAAGSTSAVWAQTCLCLYRLEVYEKSMLECPAESNAKADGVVSRGYLLESRAESDRKFVRRVRVTAATLTNYDNMRGIVREVEVVSGEGKSRASEFLDTQICVSTGYHRRTLCMRYHPQIASHARCSGLLLEDVSK